MSDERRSQGRVEAYIEVLWEGASGKYEARTVDLHTEGCFIDSTGEVAVGENISFKLQIPNADWIDVRGVVVYIYPNAGFGVRFVRISPEADLKLLEWLVKAQAYQTQDRK